jgi:Uma2 family endonuclease
MNTLAANVCYTPDDLLSMPDGDLYELIDGQLVERHMGSWSSYVGGELFTLLKGFCQAHNLGWVWPADASYQCFEEAPNRVRKPDVSFIRFGRLPDERAPEGHTRIAPDLAVEVVSPKDLHYETERKVREYLRAGVRLIWVVIPESRIVLIYRADGSISGLREDGELNGEDVVPGFRCRVGDLFQPPTPPPGNGERAV